MLQEETGNFLERYYVILIHLNPLINKLPLVIYLYYSFLFLLEYSHIGTGMVEQLM
jgi:hypothetical protein